MFLTSVRKDGLSASHGRRNQKRRTPGRGKADQREAGQPDVAEIRISYIPDVKMVESKSLKLYLFSFRSHGGFHEDCVNMIMKDLVALMDPKYIEVTGFFTPRGGISIFPYANYGRPGTKYEQLAQQRFAVHE